MVEWQKRVLVESQELDAKVQKLELFINFSSEFKNLNDFEQKRLRDQLYYMSKYSEVLHSRMIHFS